MAACSATVGSGSDKVGLLLVGGPHRTGYGVGHRAAGANRVHGQNLDRVAEVGRCESGSLVDDLVVVNQAGCGARADTSGERAESVAKADVGVPYSLHGVRNRPVVGHQRVVLETLPEAPDVLGVVRSDDLPDHPEADGLGLASAAAMPHLTAEALVASELGVGTTQGVAPVIHPGCPHG